MKRWIPLLLFCSFAIYFSFLCVKSYSWVFTSSDSGSWLAATIQWMLPAQAGGNIYLLLTHFINLFHPENLPAVLTISLSAIPSALTVVFVYLILLQLTQRWVLSLGCAIFLGGSAIFMIEASVTLYHALAICLMIAAFYTYLLDRRYLTTLLLGLAVGVHILVLPIAFFWLLADRRWKYWFKPLLLFLGVVGLSYSISLLLLWLPLPRFQVGGFDWNSIKDYFLKTSQAIVGEISVFEAPKRLLITLELLITAFGVALIPVWFSIRRPFSRATLMCFATCVFVLWYYITCLDALTWTYLAFLSPSLLILAGVGLSRLPQRHLYPIFAFALLFLILNPLFLNAGLLTEQDPKGTNYLEQLSTLPSNSIVVTDTGSLSLGLFYFVVSTHSQIMPLTYPYLDMPKDFPSADYASYLKAHYYPSLDYSSTLTAIGSALKESIPVYYNNYSGSDDVLLGCFNLDGYAPYTVDRVLSLTGQLPQPSVKEVR